MVFTVTVNSIEGSASYETVTPEEMAEMGLSYKTKEEVWEAGKTEVEKNAEETYKANAKSAVVQKVVEESTIKSVPDYLVEEEAQNYNHYLESLAQAMYNMDLETFVTNAYGVTMEQYNAQMNEMFSNTFTGSSFKSIYLLGGRYLYEAPSSLSARTGRMTSPAGMSASTPHPPQHSSTSTPSPNSQSVIIAMEPEATTA